MRQTIMVPALLIAAVVLGGCERGADDTTPTSPTPPAAAVVASVQIGGQTWMGRNLAATTDVTGMALPATAYNGDISLVESYGRLYTFDEARRACSQGWHLPSMPEWEALFAELGGIAVAGGKLKSVTGWNAPNAGASNSSGFGAVPGGGCAGATQCDGLGWAAHFWSSTTDGSAAQVPSLMNTAEHAYVLSLGHGMRASVRCVRD